MTFDLLSAAARAARRRGQRALPGDVRRCRRRAGHARRGARIARRRPATHGARLQRCAHHELYRGGRRGGAGARHCSAASTSPRWRSGCACWPPPSSSPPPGCCCSACSIRSKRREPEAWRRVMPWIGSRGERPGCAGALRARLASGWLPCGLSYSMWLLGDHGSAANGRTGARGVGLGLAAGDDVGNLRLRPRRAVLRATGLCPRCVAGALLLGFGAWDGRERATARRRQPRSPSGRAGNAGHRRRGTDAGRRAARAAPSSPRPRARTTVPAAGRPLGSRPTPVLAWPGAGHRIVIASGRGFC